MMVRVRLVSLLRDAVDGRASVELELPGRSEASLGEVLEELYKRHPRLRRLVEELNRRGLTVVYTVNGQGTEPGDMVKDGDTVALLPPASGG